MADLLLFRSFGNSVQRLPTCCECAVTTTVGWSNVKVVAVTKKTALVERRL
jgi:hypothetical protein